MTRTRCTRGCARRPPSTATTSSVSGRCRGYDDVATGFRDHAAFSNANGVMVEPSMWGPDASRFISFLGMDPPQHTAMRGLISRAFTPRRVAALEPRIREIAGQYLGAAVERGSFDFMTDLAAALPLDVISELIGVPEADRAQVRRMVDQMLHREEGIRDVPPAAVEAGMFITECYLGLIAARRRTPADDLTSALVDAGTVGTPLTDAELVAFLFLLIGAGTETTTHLQGSAWMWLRWQTRVTKAAAVSAVGWMRRLTAHPVVAAALTEGQISASWARAVCGWSDRLPHEMREDADQILAAAAAGGRGSRIWRDWRSRCTSAAGRVAPTTTMTGLMTGGCCWTSLTPARLTGDLTPGCSAALSAVLEALGNQPGQKICGRSRSGATTRWKRRVPAAGRGPDGARPGRAADPGAGAHHAGPAAQSSWCVGG